MKKKRNKKNNKEKVISIYTFFKNIYIYIYIYIYI